ncbi:MAG: alkaline phosphatase D family protein, partial [Dehalococcoidia bacterium]
QDVTFELGIASGDVTSESAVLWTRAEGAAALSVEVTTSARFDGDVREIDAETSEERDFTVKAHVDGLLPDTRYHFRFRSGDALSDAGTFVTAPDASTSQALRFVFSGDSDGSRQEDGTPVWNEFEVLDAAAADDPAFFLYFGDTIYADRTPSAEDLTGFRGKYAQNRGYEALRRIFAATSTYNTWDDHEVHNDYAGTEVDPGLFDDAQQAFREYLPIDDSGDPEILYRTFRWGADVEMILLDERSFRDDSAAEECSSGEESTADPLPAAAFDNAADALRGIRGFVGLADELPEGCEDAIKDAGRTLLGTEQKEYFLDWLSSTDATWKIVVNPVAIQHLLVSPYDRWEGFAAERREVLEYIRDEGIENVVFLTTDFHANIFGGVRLEPFDDEQIAYEAIAGPIATAQFRQEIVDVVGEAAAGGVEGFLTGLLKVDCAELHSYAYALVEVTPDVLTITAKDDTGGEMCSVTLESQP